MTQTIVKRPDGASIAVSITGTGPDLLLVTGLSGTASFWDPLLPTLASRFRVICHDQRGIANSSRGSLATSIDLLADDCLAILSHVGSRKSLLLGHSTGGVILQSMALKNMASASPINIAGLILSGTWAKPNQYMTELFRSRGEILKKTPREYAAMLGFLAYPPDWLDRHWQHFQGMLDNAPQLPEQQRMISERIAAILEFDRSGEIGKIGIPTVIQGALDDLIVPAFLQRDLAARMPGSAVVMLANGGHFFPITRPEAFVRSIDSLADRIGLHQ
jgi:aminoacrylate hydrolase